MNRHLRVGILGCGRIAQAGHIPALKRITNVELAATCERCHGPSVGTSKMAVPSLKGQNRDYLVRVMKAYRGDDRENTMMHKMSANYSDEEIEAIATYYASHPAD